MNHAVPASVSFSVLAASASATLFSQNANQASAYIADATSHVGGEVADDFVLAADASIGSIRFWGGYFDSNVPYADDFTVRIYERTGAGLPGAELLTTTLSSLVRTDTGVDAFGIDEYMYEADLDTAFSATAGVEYMISILNSGGDLNTDTSWVWETGDTNPAATVGTALTPVGGGPWQVERFADMAFELLAVPTPGTIVLAGCTCIFASRRRRK